MATNITKGDLCNWSGATRVVDMRYLDPANLKPGDNSDSGVDLRGSQLTRWMGGLASGQWAAIPGIPGYAAFSNLFNNGDAQVYANGDLLRSGKVRNVATKANGVVTISPVPLTIAEALLIGNGPKASHLSAAFNTFPFGLRPPFAFGARVTMPADMAFGSGDWPAIWALPVSLRWPPEIDAMDGYNSDPSQGPLSFNGGIVPSNGDIPNRGGSQAPVTPGPHTWVAVVYPDVCALFLDGKCTQVIQTGVHLDQQDQPGTPELWYMIINYAIQGRANSWPGAMPPGKGSFAPMIIDDVFMLAMPPVYPGPGNGGPMPLMVTASSSPGHMPVPTMGMTTAQKAALDQLATAWAAVKAAFNL